MGYNREQFEHLRRSRKEERGYEKPLWSTEAQYVDRDTGEIIVKRRLENGEYVKIKSNTKYTKDGNRNKKTITTECERSRQQRLW
tara:strand:+ start:768 stop:1022 length:255 start_codon:yes stop_codon:yes gene_type:complete